MAFESEISIPVPQRFIDEEVDQLENMSHHLFQHFQEPNLVTMPGTVIPPYARPCPELFMLEKNSGFAKARRQAVLQSRVKEIQIKVFNLLERPRTTISMIYHSTVFLLILASLFLSVILTMKEFETNKDITNASYNLEICLVIIFSLEYFLRIWSCSCHGTYKGFWGKLRFIKKPYMVIDIIVIVATTVIVATSNQSNKTNYFSVSVFRFLRFLQVLRILRLDRQRGAFKIVSHVVYEHRQELLTCWYMSFILLIACAFLVYLAEESDDQGSDNQMKDLGEGLYFALITLLTVGYGDYFPHTWMAKILTGIFAFIGTAFFALPAGILGSGFALQVAQNQKRKHFNRRRQPAALVIQYAWRTYACHPYCHYPATWAAHEVVPAKPYLDKKTSVYNRSPAGTPVGGRKISNFRKKFSHYRNSTFMEGDGYISRRSSIGATIPSALELRDRCQSDGNLLLVSPHTVEDNQATIVSLPPDYADSIQRGVITSETLQRRELTSYEKIFIRFIRKLKLCVAIKKFKEECRPYDVNDVIEHYSKGQMEMFGVIQKFQMRLEATLGVKETERIEPRHTLNSRLNAVELKVSAIDNKLDHLIRLLTDKHRPTNHEYDASNSNGDGSLLGLSTETVFLDMHDDLGNHYDHDGRAPSPRSRKRGMTVDAYELHKSMQRIKNESQDSLLEAEEKPEKHLQAPGSESSDVRCPRTGSRFTITPTVLQEADINIKHQPACTDPSKPTAVRLSRCAKCVSKSATGVVAKDRDVLDEGISKYLSAPDIPSQESSVTEKALTLSTSSNSLNSTCSNASHKSNSSKVSSSDISSKEVSQPLSLSKLFEKPAKLKDSNPVPLDNGVDTSHSKEDIAPNGTVLVTQNQQEATDAIADSSGPFEMKC